MDDVERVRRLYEAWTAGDLDSAIAGLDPGIEWIEPEDSPDAGSWRGVEGVLRSMDKWTEPFEDFGFEIVEIVPAGKRVLVQLRQHARGKGSGAEVEGEIWPPVDARRRQGRAGRDVQQPCGGAGGGRVAGPSGRGRLIWSHDLRFTRAAARLRQRRAPGP